MIKEYKKKLLEFVGISWYCGRLRMVLLVEGIFN